MRLHLALLATTLGLLALAGVAHAQPPAQVPVQGFLTDLEGAPLSGPQSITFRLFDGQASSTALFTESQSVMVEDGYFTAYLGEVSALDLGIFRTNDDVWVELEIAGEVLSPRLSLATVPYAATAAAAASATDAETVGGQAPADLAYTAGSGLTLAGRTFAVDAAAVQTRVTGTCGAVPNTVITAINGDGTVTCGAVPFDATVVQRRVVGTCAAGEAIRSIGSDGTVACVTLPTDADAVDALAAADVYVVNTGDVMTGALTLGMTDPALNLDSGNDGDTEWRVGAVGEAFELTEVDDGNKVVFRVTDDGVIELRPDGVADVMTLNPNGVVDLGEVSFTPAPITIEGNSDTGLAVLGALTMFCPEGTLGINNGGCIDTDARTATNFFAAVNACNTDGLSVCTLSELALCALGGALDTTSADDCFDLTNGGASVSLWVRDVPAVAGGSTATNYGSFRADDTFQAVSPFTSLRYFCCGTRIQYN